MSELTALARIFSKKADGFDFLIIKCWTFSFSDLQKLLHGSFFKFKKDETKK
jgi:hypothetical protein